MRHLRTIRSSGSNTWLVANKGVNKAYALRVRCLVNNYEKAVELIVDTQVRDAIITYLWADTNETR